MERSDASGPAASCWRKTLPARGTPREGWAAKSGSHFSFRLRTNSSDGGSSHGLSGGGLNDDKERIFSRCSERSARTAGRRARGRSNDDRGRTVVLRDAG